MARFAAERMKAHKKQDIFNLNDDEVLTHRGQTLAEIEKFDDPKSDDDEFSDDENKTGKLDKKFVSEAHFGGGVLSKPDSQMSRRDLIDQLIAESKKRKAEKQKIREQTIDLTEKLDSEWKDLLPLVAASKKTAQDSEEKSKADDYDIAMRELKFEARGNPTDRLKSEEEIAKEEKEKLEALEANRLARMKGFTDDSDGQPKHKSADDLDDGFYMESIEEEPLAYGEDGMLKVEKKKSNESEDHDGSEDNKSSDEDSGVDDEGNALKQQNKHIGEHLSKNESTKIELEDEEKEEQEQRIQKLENRSNEDVEKMAKLMGWDVISITSKLQENDPYDNIPVLKISDDNDNNNDKVKVQSDSTPSRTIKLKEKNLSKIIEEEENDSLNETGSEKESSEEEDNLSDLKESESSSEDDSSNKKNVRFSNSVSEKKSVSDNVDSTQKPKSILKVKNNEDSGSCKLTDETRKLEIKADLMKRKEIMEKARQELPYTYKAPDTFEELQELLEDRLPDYQSVIVERIIKCNHPSLGEGNNEKLANLFAYLLQHLNDCALGETIEDLVKCFQIFDRLCPHLYDLAHMNPLNTKICIQEVIKEKHEEFERNKKRYPGLDTLIFLKLVSLLFPTSDFRHPVVTPCLVFMSQILTRCRVKSRSAISKGLFISTLVLEYTLLSKRFAPSVINFLRGVICMATAKPPVQIIKTIPPFKSTGEFINLLIPEKEQTSLNINPKETRLNINDLLQDELNDEFRVKALLVAVNLLSEFRNQLEELEAVYSIFEPIVKLLKMNTWKRYPTNIKEHIQKIHKDLEELKNKRLEYMVLAKKKPKALRLYEPRIEKVYDGKRHKPMSKEKAEREKLLHKYKREMKGAIREVRKDRAFLAKVQIKQQIKSDAERKRKVLEIFGEASVQQGELNKIKRKKAK
ncbi:nucleolar protein 14 homolog isoform X2 [Cephus cinctus]|nr:nucleolar protein 14 homolog isoform X2 [Cephus cinctus]